MEDDQLWNVYVNDRLGRKVRIICSPKDTIKDLKGLISAQLGTKREKIILKVWYNQLNDERLVEDVIPDGSCVDLY